MEIVQLDRPTPGVPRDGYGRPLIVPASGGKAVAHTRTTTFIDCIEDKSNLVDWGKRMVMVGAAKRPDLLDDVLDLDPNERPDKLKLNTLAERCMNASGANDKREKGTQLHALSELVDSGQELPSNISLADLNDMASYKVETVDFEVIHTEAMVVVNELSVAGTPDRVSKFDGNDPNGKSLEGQLVITDLKSGSVQYGALKMASQLSIYSRGLFYDFSVFPDVDVQDKKAFAKWKKIEHPPELAATAYKPMGNVNQDWGIIMHLPAGEGVCTLYWIDLNIGWTLAKLALQIRAARSIKKAMLPFG